MTPWGRSSSANVSWGDALTGTPPGRDGLIDYRTAASEHTGPLERRSLKSEVFDVLQGRIIAGAYTPGRWLRQSDIADELEVSLTPVREALDQLVAEGLAQRVPYRGVRVPSLTDDDIADAYALRLLLEVAAARAAARHISAEEAADLLALVRQTEHLTAPSDMPRYRHLNWRIHRAVASAGGNSLLARLHGIAMNRFPDWMLYENLLQRPADLRIGLQREYHEHLALVEAVASGVPEQAAEAALHHLHGVRRDVVTSLGVPEYLLKRREEQIRPPSW